MKLQGKHYFGFFWIFFFLMIMLMSFGYNAKARLIPLVISIPCLIFALYRSYVDLTGKEKEEHTGEELFLSGLKGKVEGASEGFRQEEGEKLGLADKRRRFFDIALWILIFLALIFAVGFLYAIPIFTISFMRVKGESWVMSLVSGLGLVTALYLAFVVGTQSYLYEGLLIPLLKG